MFAIRTILRRFLSGAFIAGLAGHLSAGPVRDTSVPMQATSGYQKARLVGHWFEVARSQSMLEPDCHAVTADVATRDDSRLTLRMACHKGRVTGPVLDIDGILVEVEPGVFMLRLVRLRQLGDHLVVVLWQAPDDSLAVVGSPEGQIGWVWSKTADVDPATLAAGIDVLVAAGYSATLIHQVDHDP